jgi:hypothetical protein
LFLKSLMKEVRTGSAFTRHGDRDDETLHCEAALCCLERRSRFHWRLASKLKHFKPTTGASASAIASWELRAVADLLGLGLTVI